MYTIAFDTTAASCSVALMKDDKLLDSFVEEMDFGQAEVLIPAIRDLLAKHNLEVRDLGLMVVCVGPGSFTGVRSSISAADPGCLPDNCPACRRSATWYM